MPNTPWSKLEAETFLSQSDETELGRWGIGQGPDAPDRRILRLLVGSVQPEGFLEVGCGAGIEVQGFIADGTTVRGYRGYDFTPKFVNYCREHYPHGTFSVVDVLDLDEQGTADMVYCRHLLEHIDDGVKAFHNLCQAARDYVVISWFIRPSWEEERIERVGEFIHHTYSARDLIRVARQYGNLYRFDFDHHFTKASVWVIVKTGGYNEESESAIMRTHQFMETESFLSSCLPVPPDPQEELHNLLDVLSGVVDGYDGLVEVGDRAGEYLDIIAQTSGALFECITIMPPLETMTKAQLRTVIERAKSALENTDPEEVAALVREARTAQSRAKSVLDATD
jgi:SAM-dependent methyltransferase